MTKTEINYKLFILPLQAKGKQVVGEIGWATDSKAMFGVPYISEQLDDCLKMTKGWV